jgi:glycosyltransferase involved in cell wall biosynthesis
MILSISVVILTYNEEKNIDECLKSISGITREIFIVDSGSTDGTVNIAEKYTDKIYTNKFENYSQQRNWAFDNLPITTEWILNLDADHRITHELKDELLDTFSKTISDDINGYLISRKTVFMDRWIKHGGHYPSYHAVLFRKGCGLCEERKYDQHFVVDGKLEKLRGDIVDVVTDNLTTFTMRHNRWSDSEVEEQVDKDSDQNQIQPKFLGNPIERKRYLKKNYEHIPLLIRPFLYFIYRYFFRLGFLDGKEGLIFHVLQGFWFRFLIDAKIYEFENRK